MEAVKQDFPDSSGDAVDTPARRSRWETLLAQSAQAVARRRLLEAAGYLEEALAQAAVDWPGSRRYAESCVRLADLRAALDRRSEALKLYGEAIAMLGDQPDGIGPLLAHAVSNMGRMYLLGGDQAKGRELAAAADTMAAMLGEPDSPSIKLNLAMVSAHAGDDEGAEKTFRAAVAALDQLEAGDPQGIAVLDNYALYCLSLGMTEQAEDLLRQCLILRQEVAGPRHALYAAGLVNLGRLLHVYRGAAEDAEPLFWQGKDIFERGQITTSSGLLAALYFLACIAQEDGRNAEVSRLSQAIQKYGADGGRSGRAAEVASGHIAARVTSAEGGAEAGTEKRLAELLRAAESLDGNYRRLGVDIAAGILAELSELTGAENRNAEAGRLAVRAAEMRGRLLWAVSGQVFQAPS